MKFYVDFDDCLCETALSFTEIAKRLFGKDVPYEKVRFFDLKKAFDLTDEEYHDLMVEGHKSEILLSYKETPGASRVINKLIDLGHEVFIITGRPYNTYDASRRWLDEHDLERVQLFFLNKYGRDFFITDSNYNLELEDFYKMTFDYAIEDSPMAFKYFDHFPELNVLVFDRPWNRDCDFPNTQYRRCLNWESIEAVVEKE